MRGCFVHNRISARFIDAFLERIKKQSLVSSMFVSYWGFFIQKRHKYWVLIPCSIGIPICLIGFFFFLVLEYVTSSLSNLLQYWISILFFLLSIFAIDHEHCLEERPNSWCQMEYILKFDRNMLIFRWRSIWQDLLF